MRSRLLVRQLPIVRRLVLALLLGLLFAGKSAAEPLPGQIVADESGYLKRHQGRHVFICGPGDPEGFLYRGNLQADQTRDGDQVQLIRRLLEYGGNCLYLQAVRSHGGDGTADHNPFREHDPSQGIQPAVLEQWESWFQLLDEHGMLIYFFFYDDSSDPWRTGDDVSEQEAAFVRQIVQRFQHHRHLIWVVAEESEEALSPVRAQKLARLIRATDEHQHLIGNHHHSGTDFKAYQPETAFDHYAMQLNICGGGRLPADANCLRSGCWKVPVDLRGKYDDSTDGGRMASAGMDGFHGRGDADAVGNGRGINARCRLATVPNSLRIF